MAIDLCVVSFNNIKELPRLLDFLDSGSYPNKWDGQTNWNLFIADNDSSDGTREALKELLQFQLTHFDPLIFFNENIGYARACNQLAAQGTAEIIGFLNADVWLS